MMKSNIASVILISLAYVGCTVRALQNTTTIPETEQAPSSIKETVDSLKQIKTDSFEYRIPPAAKPLLSGNTFDVPIAHVWAIQEGVVVRIQFYIDNPTMLAAV